MKFHMYVLCKSYGVGFSTLYLSTLHAIELVEEPKLADFSIFFIGPYKLIALHTTKAQDCKFGGPRYTAWTIMWPFTRDWNDGALISPYFGLLFKFNSKLENQSKEKKKPTWDKPPPYWGHVRARILLPWPIKLASLSLSSNYVCQPHEC